MFLVYIFGMNLWDVLDASLGTGEIERVRLLSYMVALIPHAAYSSSSNTMSESRALLIVIKNIEKDHHFGEEN